MKTQESGDDRESLVGEHGLEPRDPDNDVIGEAPNTADDDDAKPPGPFLGWRNSLPYLVAFGLFSVWLTLNSDLRAHAVPYSTFRAHLAAGELDSCVIREATIVCALAEAVDDSVSEGVAAASRSIRVVPIDDPELVTRLEEAGVEYRAERPSGLVEAFAWLLPFAILIGFWIFMMRRASGMGSPGASMMGFGKSRAKLVAVQEVGVSFADVAGCDEAKQELLEVVDFLKNPGRYTLLGAKIPRGVLLVGPPGTGKTLLARAVAGEARVPFFSISGSEFVEMFVGVGAARVRDLFEQAKKQAPCIVFIDELDAVGRRRGVHLAMANDERENTLNQLLVELDGFERNVGVILLSATNRPDVLDPALLRPGRFDRQVVLDSPDAKGREAILRVHTRELPLGESVELSQIARATPGFSGADLANAVNEAALLTARRGGSTVEASDLEEAVEKVVAGPERKSHRLTGEALRRVAFHEAGHALAAYYTESGPEVRKISIVPRGRAALGYTLQLPANDSDAMIATQGVLIDRLRGLLGGRASEEIVFGEPSTGAENDLQQATSLARQLVCQFGMGRAAGLMHCARDPAMMGSIPTAFDWETGGRSDCSDATSRAIDEEVIALLAEAYENAKKLLGEHRTELDAVVAALLEHETINGEDLADIVTAARSESGETPV